MDYERVFRKVDPDWYLEEMFVRAGRHGHPLHPGADGLLPHRLRSPRGATPSSPGRRPERIIPLGGVDPRAPNAVEQVERQITELGMTRLRVVHGRVAR